MRVPALVLLAMAVTGVPGVELLHRDRASGERELLRLHDGARLTVAGEAWQRLQPGAYRYRDSLVLVRAGEDAAAWAASTHGAPTTSTREDAAEMAVAAESGTGFTPLTLPIWCWRHADDFPWPWVVQPGIGGGLAAILRRYNPRRAGFAYDREQGVYRDDDGRGILIGDSPSAVAPFGDEPAARPITVVLGDLVAGESDQPLGPQGILVADHGRIGFLDPADEVITCFGPDGLPAERVRRLALGDLVGPEPIHIYRRDRQRAEDLRAGRLQPDNPVWNLSPRRQWLTLAGMAVLIIVLLRAARKARRRG
jgi:hypothetical protein